MSERIKWPEYALRLAETAAIRSEDPYQKVGACILRADHSVAALGYNGAPPGITIDWSDRDDRRKRVLHAELNALRYCRPGEGKILAVTLSPCIECLKGVVAHGIHEIVFRERYRTLKETATLAKEFGVTLTELPLNGQTEVLGGKYFAEQFLFCDLAQ